MNKVGSRHGEPWSESELIELGSLVTQGMGHKQIAAQFGRSEEAVRARMHKVYGATFASPAGKRQRRRHSGASFFLS